MKRRTPEERYKYSLRKQQKTLEEFASHEIEWAEHLIEWYRLRKEEMPDDEYRGVAYFINKEFIKKPGSLTLLYLLYNRLMDELPKPTKELAFDLLAYRYKQYGVTLIAGGY
jgi:hypothetical protein